MTLAICMQGRTRIASLACLALCLPLLAVTGQESQHEIGAHDTVGAKRLFDRHCAKCHGRDGEANRLRGIVLGARNLTHGKWQARVTDDQIRAAIEKGPGAMPSFGKKLSRAETDALVAYVRSFHREPRNR